MPLPTGHRLGPYEILAPLGSGGMGEVYRARDPRLERTVAIKTVHGAFSDRFEREARAIAALNHPHICQIYDVGPDYLVMELIDGKPLQGPLPLSQTLQYASQIAGALDAAHRKGIAHRDLKPANILITKTGAKLLDFGLAKTVQSPVQSSSPDDFTKVRTGRNEIVGTLHYMSPEQLQPGSREVDTRTDIFSFGLLLYEMLTGQRAFDGAEPTSVIAAILERPAPSIGAVAPPALDRLLQRCLAKDPDDRWQTARDLRAELEWIAAMPEAVHSRRQSRWQVLAVALLAVAAATGAFFLFRHGQPPPAPRMKFVLDIPKNANWHAPSFSPDGKQISFTTDQGAVTRAIDSLETKLLADVRGYGAWSSDGRFRTAFGGSELVKIPLDGGQPQSITPAQGTSRGSAWTKDGIILFSTAGPLFRVSESGGTPVQLTPDTAIRPVLLPDDKHYLYVSVVPGETAHTVYLSSLSNPADKRKIGITNSQVEFSPTGHLVFLRGTTLMAQPFDPQGLKATGEPFPIASDVSLNTVGTLGDFSVSSNGLIVYQTGGLGRTSVAWLDRAGKTLGVLDDSNFHLDLAISPDGSAVAATRIDPKSLVTSAWITDLKRSITSRLTTEADDVENPAWSPDGRHIAYSDTDGKVYIRDTVGSGDRELVGEGMKRPSWSPDGATLAGTDVASSINPQLRRSLLLVAAGGKQKPVPYLTENHSLRQPVFSPDGHWMAYVSDESGDNEVFVQSIPAGHGKWQISKRGGTQPIWRRDGKELFYKSKDDHILAVPVKTDASFEAGIPKELFEAHANLAQLPYARRQYSVSPDGQKFLVNQRKERQAQTILLQNWLPPAR